jgi:hypothetical protein
MSKFEFLTAEDWNALLSKIISSDAPIMGGDLDADSNIIHSIAELGMTAGVTLTADSDYITGSTTHRWYSFNRTGLNVDAWDNVGRIRDATIAFMVLSCQQDDIAQSTVVLATYANVNPTYGTDTTFLAQSTKSPTGDWPAGTTSWRLTESSEIGYIQVNHNQYGAGASTCQVRGFVYLMPHP